jgi:hypothetical protein
MPWQFLSKVGTLTRHVSDRYPERCAWAYGITVFPASPNDGFIELHNDDQQGRNLKIYGFVPGTQNTFGLYLAVVKGPVGSNPPAEAGRSLAQNIVPVTLGYPSPPGVVLAGSVAHAALGAAPVFPVLAFAPSFSTQFLTPGPLCVVQGGFSALGYAYGLGQLAEVSLFYMWD